MGVDLAESFYEESEPARDVRDLVACNWVRVVRLLGVAEPTPIIPDGCADIMVVDDAPPFVAGPDATTRWITEREGTVIVGIRLRPGAASSVFGCPATRILNGGALLSDLAPGAGALHERLRSTSNLLARHALLEDFVRTAMRAHGNDRAMIAACRWLTADPGLEIGTLATQLDWTARTLHRRFQNACGYGPKHFQRIMRVQKAIRAAHEAPRPRLARVAQAAGFADQAHMTRDFRDITGFTPARYFAIAAPGVGAWLDEDW
jgi:AraC-like DNA-binding protein